MNPHGRHVRLLTAATLLVMGVGAALAFSMISPAAADPSSGCSRSPGQPNTGSDGTPTCLGFGDDCYYCEYVNPNGGYTVCSEYPDPSDGMFCQNTPILPGPHPRNQTP